MRVLFLMLGTILVPIVHARAVLPSDIASSPHREAIESLYSRGIVHGYPDGAFRPQVPINRAEFLKILMLAVFGEEALEVSDTRCFDDFSEETEWYYPHACIAKKRGIIHGHPDGTFRGTDTVKLAEALKMSMEAWDVPLPQYFRAPDNWYDPYLDAAASKAIFRVLPSSPGFELTRAEAAALLVAMNEPITVLDPDYSDPEKRIVSIPLRQQMHVPPDLSTCGNGVIEEGEYCDDGNTENGDGCSSICYVVPEPVYHGALRIEQQPLATINVSKGTKDVLLLSFEAVAGRQDGVLTNLKFTSTQGTLGDAENFRLYVDTDGDGTAETLVSTAGSQGEIVAFHGFEVLVKEGFLLPFELRADVRSSGTVESFSVGFATHLAGYVEGYGDEDGQDITGIETDNGPCNQESICWIAVHTQTPRLISIGGTQGNLFVTKDTTPVRSRQLLLGLRSDVLLRLNFFAEQEDITVKKITIGGATDSIDTLELYEEHASEPFAIAYKSACSTVVTGQFCADTAFVIPKDHEKEVLVRAVSRTDTDGGTSGQTVTLTLTSATSGTVAIEAEGNASLLLLDQNDGDSAKEGEIFIGRSNAGSNTPIEGVTHDLVGAKFASIENSHVDPDETPVPVGQATFGQFRFEALPNENTHNGLNTITIRDIEFTVQSTNVQFQSSSFELFNALDSGTSITCSENATTGIITLTCADLENQAPSTSIGPGQFIDLALRGTITDAAINDAANSTLQAQIKNLGDRNKLDAVIWDDDVFPFQWIDRENSTVRSTLYRTD